MSIWLRRYKHRRKEDSDQGFGTEVAFKVKSNIQANEDIYFKGGINYRTKSGFQIGAEYYMTKPQETRNDVGYLFGFNLGIEF